MKVLQIYKDYYPPVKGGIEKHINLLANGLSQQGVDVEVLVSNVSRKLDIEYNNNIRIIKAPQLGRIASAPINLTFSRLLIHAAEKADLLHFHLPNPTAVIAYLFSGIQKPVVVTYHSDIVRQKVLKKLYTPFSKWFLAKADAIIATSVPYAHTSDELLHYHHKCHIIPLGIQLAGKKTNNPPAISSEDLHKRFGPQLIIFVGKFRYYKGVNYLVEAMKEVDATLLLIGSGPLEYRLKGYVESLALQEKIIFLGEVSDKDISSYFKACDVGVLPSIYKSEAFGMVLLEAMAYGKAVVSTELGTGTSFVNVNNETGLVVPPRNVKALSAAINRLLNDRDLRIEYGEAGKQRVKQCFDIQKMIDQVMSVYSATLK
ncbi:MAG: glycosyltransferase [Desulfobacteraceae bacterium]|nr:glycosyltransferase [Desulfobacteraceae bacterium]